MREFCLRENSFFLHHFSKSRLVRELGRRGARLFVGNCGESSKQSTAFSCFREALSGLLGVNRFAPASEQLNVLSK